MQAGRKSAARTSGVVPLEDVLGALLSNHHK
jgi:hypothetical protein